MSLPASLANKLELPVVGSPLFIVSGPELVIAQCKAGIVGSFPALNARPAEKLGEWLAVAREHARFVITGTLSGQLAAAGTGRVAPVVLDSTQILLRKITIRGYSADDNPEARDEWFRRLADWCRSGDIALPHVVIDGLEQATLALADTARGRYFGMVVIRL